MPTTDAQGRTISDDGNWWWDGNAWQPIRKSFFDTVGDAVDSAVRKVEGSGVVGAAPTPVTVTPEVPAEAVPPVAAQAGAAAGPTSAEPPASPASTPAWSQAIPPADLLAYLGALHRSGVVSDTEFESIRARIPDPA